MADSVEMQDIRGLDIDKLAKGFAESSYKFKEDCTVLPISTDSIRWYQKTAGTLTATAPAYISNVSPLSTPASLEVTWTRNTSYVKKYIVEGALSVEDIQQADVDVLGTEGASLWLSPKDYTSLVNWLISGKGSSIPSFSSQKITTGTIMQILGLNVKVSNNVTADYALVIIPRRATTFRQGMSTTSRVIDEPGISKKIRVWESGIAYNTDPKAIVLITDTQT